MTALATGLAVGVGVIFILRDIFIKLDSKTKK